MEAPGDTDDPLAAWHEVTRGGAGEPAAEMPRPRGPLLAAAAVATALVVGAAAGAALGQPAPPVPEPVPSPSAPPADREWNGGHDSAAVDSQAHAAAVVAVRMAAGDDRYVDTAVTEAVEELDGVTVVTVRAVVLPRERDRWGSPAVARYAVAVARRDGAAVAVGDPWTLPPPPHGSVERGEPVTDPARIRAARAALHTAGYRDLRDMTLTAAVGGLLVAGVTAHAPGETAARSHAVWLTGDATAVLPGPAERRHDDEEVP